MSDPLNRQLRTLFGLLLFGISFEVEGRSFRPDKIPNGTVFNCQNCHLNPFGGGTRNSFGQAVFSAIGGSSGQTEFWNPTLAAMDSDGDGFSNGVELGDPDGDGVPDRTTGISNPGDFNSRPVLPNTAPTITSSPVTSAVKGIAYAYQATASDGEGNAITFSKVAGPDWLSVAANGAVTGTPPDNAKASETVTLRATDNGSPPAFSEQSYTLTITASFLGWQRLHFASGENDPQAGPGTIAPGRVNPNLIKYALRGSPSANDTLAFPLSFNGSQQATFFIDIRDDDPNLVVTAEIADRVDFSNPSVISAAISDPTPGDGFKRLSFTDAVANSAGRRRFVRLKFSR